MRDGRRAFVTDLDGTLIDTRAANRAAYVAAFAEFGEVIEPSEYDRCFGLDFRDLARQVAPGMDDERLKAVSERKAALYPNYFGDLQQNDALVDLLRVLADARVPVGLATTARRSNAEAVLRHFGLMELFSVLVTAEDVRRGKPAPDCYLRAAQLLGRRPEDCVVFEDSAAGVAAANAAGCKVMEVVL